MIAVGRVDPDVLVDLEVTAWQYFGIAHST
jgi:hypothetical protein